jgi:hypothetical protein
MMKIWGLIAVAILAVWSSVAGAQGRGQVRDVPIQAFFGTFNGSGFAEGTDKDYFGATLRDMDINIAAAPDGFVATWTTVVRGGGDPANPRARKRSTTVAFKGKAGKTGQYIGTESADPQSGKPAVWARIAGQTLYIYELNILDDGRYDMQTYARTLQGGGMDVVFTRLVDGEAQRSVKGKLIKIAK